MCMCVVELAGCRLKPSIARIFASERAMCRPDVARPSQQNGEQICWLQVHINGRRDTSPDEKMLIYLNFPDVYGQQRTSAKGKVVRKRESNPRPHHYE